MKNQKQIIEKAREEVRCGADEARLEGLAWMLDTPADVLYMALKDDGEHADPEEVSELKKQLEESGEKLKQEQEMAALQAEETEGVRKELEKAGLEKEKLETKITELKQKIDYLQTQTEIVKQKDNIMRLGMLDRNSAGEKASVVMLNCGKEKNLYGLEIQGIILDALEKELKSGVAKDSRRESVIKELLESNSSSGALSDIRNEMKDFFRDFKGACSTDLGSLSKYGITYEKQGAHTKLYLGGDDRYVVTLSDTPSDVRAGKNISSLVNRNFY